MATALTLNLTGIFEKQFEQDESAFYGFNVENCLPIDICITSVQVNTPLTVTTIKGAGNDAEIYDEATKEPLNEKITLNAGDTGQYLVQLTAIPGTGPGNYPILLTVYWEAIATPLQIAANAEVTVVKD